MRAEMAAPTKGLSGVRDFEAHALELFRQSILLLASNQHDIAERDPRSTLRAARYVDAVDERSKSSDANVESALHNDARISSALSIRATLREQLDSLISPPVNKLADSVLGQRPAAFTFYSKPPSSSRATSISEPLIDPAVAAALERYLRCPAAKRPPGAELGNVDGSALTDSGFDQAITRNTARSVEDCLASLQTLQARNATVLARAQTQLQLALSEASKLQAAGKLVPQLLDQLERLHSRVKKARRRQALLDDLVELILQRQSPASVANAKRVGTVDSATGASPPEGVIVQPEKVSAAATSAGPTASTSGAPFIDGISSSAFGIPNVPAIPLAAAEEVTNASASAAPSAQTTARTGDPLQLERTTLPAVSFVVDRASILPAADRTDVINDDDTGSPSSNADSSSIRSSLSLAPDVSFDARVASLTSLMCEACSLAAGLAASALEGVSADVGSDSGEETGSLQLGDGSGKRDEHVPTAAVFASALSDAYQSAQSVIAEASSSACVTSAAAVIASAEGSGEESALALPQRTIAAPVRLIGSSGPFSALSAGAHLTKASAATGDSALASSSGGPASTLGATQPALAVADAKSSFHSAAEPLENERSASPFGLELPALASSDALPLPASASAAQSPIGAVLVRAISPYVPPSRADIDGFVADLGTPLALLDDSAPAATVADLSAAEDASSATAAYATFQAAAEDGVVEATEDIQLSGEVALGASSSSSSPFGDGMVDGSPRESVSLCFATTNSSIPATEVADVAFASKSAPASAGVVIDEPSPVDSTEASAVTLLSAAVDHRAPQFLAEAATDAPLPSSGEVEAIDDNAIAGAEMDDEGAAAITSAEGDGDSPAVDRGSSAGGTPQLDNTEAESGSFASPAGANADPEKADAAADAAAPSSATLLDTTVAAEASELIEPIVQAPYGAASPVGAEAASAVKPLEPIAATSTSTAASAASAPSSTAPIPASAELMIATGTSSSDVGASEAGCDARMGAAEGDTGDVTSTDTTSQPLDAIPLAPYDAAAEPRGSISDGTDGIRDVQAAADLNGHSGREDDVYSCGSVKAAEDEEHTEAEFEAAAELDAVDPAVNSVAAGGESADSSGITYLPRTSSPHSVSDALEPLPTRLADGASASPVRVLSTTSVPDDAPLHSVQRHLYFDDAPPGDTDTVVPSVDNAAGPPSAGGGRLTPAETGSAQLPLEKSTQLSSIVEQPISAATAVPTADSAPTEVAKHASPVDSASADAAAVGHALSLSAADALAQALAHGPASLMPPLSPSAGNVADEGDGPARRRRSSVDINDSASVAFVASQLSPTAAMRQHAQQLLLGSSTPTSTASRDHAPLKVHSAGPQPTAGLALGHGVSPSASVRSSGALSTSNVLQHSQHLPPVSSAPAETAAITAHLRSARGVSTDSIGVAAGGGGAARLCPIPGSYAVSGEAPSAAEAALADRRAKLRHTVAALSTAAISHKVAALQSHARLKHVATPGSLSPAATAAERAATTPQNVRPSRLLLPIGQPKSSESRWPSRGAVAAASASNGFGKPRGRRGSAFEPALATTSSVPSRSESGQPAEAITLDKSTQIGGTGRSPVKRPGTA